ncbi:MAG: phosphate signaling complex protein PhoU [Oscillospiraceae bacterium]|nr:phosphate signaling complex protein PhoU [Oscillospiraceae bacterium]
MSRTRYDEQLRDMNNSLIKMGAYIERAITRATKAFMEQDVPLAKEAIEFDREINDMEKDIERICLSLLLHQQPIAGDLRLVSTALKMITDMERIGDHAADISEITLLLADTVYVSKMDHIPQMADATIKMVTQSIDAYVNRDLDLAWAVIKADDWVDELFNQVKSGLIGLIHEDTDNGEQALDLLMVAKYFERIGDHAVNIGEWVIFSLTGEHKNKRII